MQVSPCGLDVSHLCIILYKIYSCVVFYKNFIPLQKKYIKKSPNAKRHIEMTESSDMEHSVQINLLYVYGNNVTIGIYIGPSMDKEEE